MKEFVEYAADRGVMIIPEIDMPGHMLALLASHPEVGCLKDSYEVETRFGVFEDVLCPAKEDTYTLLEDIIRSLSDVFPSPVFHYGGDECPTDNWKKCPDCQALMRKMGYKDERQLQGYFSDRVSEILGKYGKRTAAWQEAADGEPKIIPLLSIWLDASRIEEYSRKGYDMLISTHDDGAYLNYNLMRGEEDGGVYGVNTLEKSYFIHTNGKCPGKGRIVGGEAALWTEYILFPFEASHMLFPRLAAIAEAFWIVDVLQRLKHAGFWPCKR